MASEQITSEITSYLPQFPERRDDHPLDTAKRDHLAAVVTRWRTEADRLTGEEVQDLVDLQATLHLAESELARSPVLHYAIREILERAQKAAGPPDTTIPDLVDRFYGT
jgi:hypothetical protein